MNFITNFKHQENLNITNLDLINKYNIQNFYKIPKIISIKFKLYLDEFALSGNVIDNEEKVEIISKIKMLIIIFFFLGTNPIIKNQFIKGSKSKITLIEKIFINIDINKKFFYNFLSNLFIENFNFLNCKAEYITNKLGNKGLIKFFVPLQFLFDLYFLLDSKLFLTNLKEKYIEIFCIVNNSNIFNSSEQNIKNIPFLWHNSAIILKKL